MNILSDNLPGDIYSYIAYFLGLTDLKQFHQANRSISRNQLIKKHIFGLRLLKNVNCRHFMPTELAKQKQCEFLKQIDPESFRIKDSNLYKNFYVSLKHDDLHFGNAGIYFKKDIGFIECIMDIKKADLALIRQLYPYGNITKGNINSYPTVLFDQVTIRYDHAPEKYITFEQVERDLYKFYEILKQNDLVLTEFV